MPGAYLPRPPTRGCVTLDKFIPVLVNKAVKGFEPSRKWATKWFPDVKLEESVE